MKAGLALVYPPQCPGCGTSVGREGTLCPDCWREAQPLGAACCPGCAVPTPAPGEFCDDCLQRPPPWRQARAAMVYEGSARRMVLAFKHGDRPDLAPVLGGWLADAAAGLAGRGTIIAPIPLHPRRLLRRRYNQALLLAQIVARRSGARLVPDLLSRMRATAPQDHGGAALRAANIAGAMAVTGRHHGLVRGMAVLLIDDVMTSGATLRQATELLLDDGAACVDVAVFARTPKQRERPSSVLAEPPLWRA